MIPSATRAGFHCLPTFRLIFDCPSETMLRSREIGASLQFRREGGEVPSGVAKTWRTGLDHGEDVAMMNLRRAAVFMVVLAFTAMAQDYSPSGPLSHRMTTGESASVAERATLTVPAETEVKVQVLSGIHSQINHVNDPVIAEVLKPVFVEGKACPAARKFAGWPHHHDPQCRSYASLGGTGHAF